MIECPKYTIEQIHNFDNLPSGVLINVENGTGGLKYFYSNTYLSDYLGYERDEFIRMMQENPFAAIYEADWDKTKRARAAVMEGQIVDSISRQKKKDGSIVWILAHLRRVEVDGKTGLLFLFSRIQELIGLQNELTEKNKTWTDILQSVPIGLLVFKEENGVRTTLSVNQSLITFANSIGTQMDSKHRDWSEAEMAMIFNQDIYAFCENEDMHLVDDMMKRSETEPSASCTFRLRGSKMGNTVYVFATCASKMTGENCRTYYVTYQNATEDETRKQELFEKQDQLFSLSYYDALTGVKNRNAYNEYVERCRKEHIYDVGFAFCDVNGLKKTNDTLGHYYGDKLICRLTTILKEYFDPSCVYRLSGDEFIVICPEIERELFQKKIKGLLSQIEEEECLASVGTLWKEEVSDIQRRTTQAEQIMYVEKQRYYENSRTITSKHRPLMLENLLKEFDEGRFVMYLQPKTSIDGNKVIGAEALARKYDADGSVMAPYSFVPQLEHELLIPKLDFFMLNETCAFLEEQHLAGNDAFSVSVNVSRVTIVENEFVETVTAILNQYDFIRNNLEIELTESNKTLDSIKLEEYLIELKKLGVKVSLDDMGTDYSSLTLLTLDGFDWVKLDRSLTVQLDQEKARVLIKHIINTCHDLNLRVIAEGVETDEFREILLAMGCDAYQGYLKSKPIPADEFKERFLG